MCHCGPNVGQSDMLPGREGYFLKDPGHLKEYVYFRDGIEAKFARPLSNSGNTLQSSWFRSNRSGGRTQPARVPALDSKPSA